MQLVRYLNDVQICEAALDQGVILVLTDETSSLHGDGSVDILNIEALGTRCGEVSGLEDRAIDELAPVLSHLLFMNYT